MKKTLLALSLLTPLTTFAAANFIGPYATLSLGSSAANVQSNHTLATSGQAIDKNDPYNDYTNSTTTHQALTNMPDINLAAGTGFKFDNQLYLGAEAFYNTSIGKKETKTTNSINNGAPNNNDKDFKNIEHYQSKLSESGSYGANVNFGRYFATNNLIYGQLGAVWAKFSQSNSSNTPAYFYDAQQLTTSGNAFNKTDQGYNLGLGYLSMLSPHLGLRVSYNYQMFNPIDTQFIGNIHNHYKFGTDKNINTTLKTSYKPTNSQILFGISYFLKPQAFQANTTNVAPRGAYVVTQLGSNITSMNMETKTTDNVKSDYGFYDANQPGTSDEQQSITTSSFLTGIGAGYRYTLPKAFSIAGEVYFQPLIDRVKYEAKEALSGYPGVPPKNHTINYNFEKSLSWGASILPTYQLNTSNDVFIRLGYNQSNYKLTVTESGEPYNHVAPSNFSKSTGGFEYGVGFESAIDSQWSLRTEYDHTDNGKIETKGKLTVSDKSIDKTFDYKPSSDQFILGLIYHF